LKDWGQTLLDFIYLKSGACRFCQRSWVVGDFSSGCGDLCDECRSGLTSWPDGLDPCPDCGRFFETRDFPGGERCAECRSDPLPFSACGVVGPYTGLLRQAIHRLKYQGSRELARPLAMLLSERVKVMLDAGQGEPVLVIPVPLHPGRLSSRGFNQSELLAEELVRQLGPGTRAVLRADILTRRVDTPSQTGLTRFERRLNLIGAFQVAEGKDRDLAGRRVLLVDDIITTGSTSGECAQVLMRAGCGPVSLGVLAAGVIGR
jgi:ComF family protein